MSSKKNSNVSNAAKVSKSSKKTSGTKMSKSKKTVKVIKPVVKKKAVVQKKVIKKAEVKVVEVTKETSVTAPVKKETPKVTETKETKEVKPAKKKLKRIVVSNRQIITGSTNGKTQQRTVGSRIEKNNWGHFVGSIGAKIDTMISKSNFTKKQMQAFAGTKMSRVNAHIHHLRKDKGYNVLIDAKSKIVSFG